MYFVRGVLKSSVCVCVCIKFMGKKENPVLGNPSVSSK